MTHTDNMRRKFRHLESLFQICVVLGMMAIVSAEISDLQEYRSELRLLAGALIVPAGIGAVLLRGLRKQVAAERELRP